MKPKLLILNAEDWSFCSHRLAAARAARAEGFEVSVATHVTRHGDQIAREGFKLLPLRWKRGGLDPRGELAAIAELVRLYRAERPALVHHVAAKPILYGAVAARLAGVPAVVNTLTGAGYVFASDSAKARALRPAVRRALTLALAAPNSACIFQNQEDLELFAAGDGARRRAALIPGSGVDLDVFTPAAEPPDTPLVVLPSRMLRQKGVAEFVTAARLLAESGVRARLALVGASDPENPDSVPVEQLSRWSASGDVEWWGPRADMPRVYAQCHVVALPSYYGEGLPKCLLEAAACGRPAVTTDWPGCRDAVRHEETGLLVPARDPLALAAALRRLLLDPSLRERLGRRARELAIQRFGEGRIAAQTLEVYRRMLDGPGGRGGTPR